MPRAIWVAIFHVRDAAPVKKLLAGLHRRPSRKQSGPAGKRGDRAPARKGARDAGHAPLYLAGDDHLIFLAPSRASADPVRRALVRALGEAVEYVETKLVKVPKAARGATSRPRRAAPPRR